MGLWPTATPPKKPPKPSPTAGGALIEQWGDEFKQRATDAQYAAADYLAAVPAGARNTAIATFNNGTP